ncbi:MAG: NUDIX hydrolase [Bacteroidota bacterium]
MSPWKTLSRTPVLVRGRYLTVEDHRIQLPDGRVIDDWPWLAMPDYVNVIAETAAGRFILFRQTKYAVGASETLAPIGGYCEPEELPEATARRELLEESGYEAAEWISLGSYVADGNRGGGRAHLFLARGARQTSSPRSDDLEAQRLVTMTRAELRHALSRGEFRVLPWAACVALALLALEANTTR